MADFFSLTIKEEFLLEALFLKLQKLLSTKVCVLAVELSLLDEELSLLDESSFFEQEMTVRLKRNMEKMMSICLTRVPISGLGEPNI